MPTTNNRRQRRSAKDRKAEARAEAIRLAYAYLANAATPCTTGGTLILPDGSMSFLSAEGARKLHGKAKPDGAK
jgi:hypothetical protein